jgi:hypothetical protein
MAFNIRASAAGLAALVSACVTASGPGDALSGVAEDYVHIVLAIGEHEEGYIDAYFGPPEWQDAAAAEARTLDDILAAVADARLRLAALDDRRLETIEILRKRRLEEHLVAAEARARMLKGQSYSFDAETKALYGVTVPPTDWAGLDAALAEIDALLPGDGPIEDRVAAFRARFDIPTDRLEATLAAAIDECRARSAPHIALPVDESFTVEFVTDKSWSGYNWYQGDHRSLIQINTDLPTSLPRAVVLACHEGYPGHHVFSLLREQRLYRDRGWAEFSVFPLFGPDGLIAEGTAELGIEVAFSDEERTAFERDVLSPLAGLDATETERRVALEEATEKLLLARIGIARDYLDGKIPRERAVALQRRYGLVTPERAEQLIDFAETYRGYVVNYGYGFELTRAYLDRVAGDDPDARWSAFERLIATPAVVADLR